MAYFKHITALLIPLVHVTLVMLVMVGASIIPRRVESGEQKASSDSPPDCMMMETAPTSTVAQQIRAAPVAGMPPSLPTSANVVGADPSTATPDAVVPIAGNSSSGGNDAKGGNNSTASSGTEECPRNVTTITSPPTSGTSQEDEWIKIAGILVPAIVAIGLGVGGFCVTLHVNSPRRQLEEVYLSQGLREREQEWAGSGVETASSSRETRR